jgi:hypothetical protein
VDPYGNEAPGFPALDVRADTLGKKEQNTASAFQGARTAQHTNDQRIKQECEKTPLGTGASSQIDPPRVRGYDMSHNTNRVDNKFATPTDRPVILSFGMILRMDRDQIPALLDFVQSLPRTKIEYQTRGNAKLRIVRDLPEGMF